MQVKHEEVEGGDPKYHPRDREEEVVERGEVAEPVPEGQTPAEEGIVFEENLETAQHPAPTLDNVGREVFRGQSDRQVFVDEDRLPSPGMEVLAGMNVFGDAHQVKSIQRGDRRPSKDGPAADEERPAPALATALDRVIEQVLFVRNARAGAEGPLKNILVVEVVRRLHKADAGVSEKRDGL